MYLLMITFVDDTQKTSSRVNLDTVKNSGTTSASADNVSDRTEMIVDNTVESDVIEEGPLDASQSSSDLPSKGLLLFCIW